MRRFYGVRLSDLWSGRESLRHVGVLIRGLPVESALVAALPPAPAGKARPSRWSSTDWLLADVFDVLAAANWQRSGDSKAPKPKPYPRPTDVPPEPVVLSSGLTDAQLAKLRARGPRRDDGDR